MTNAPIATATIYARMGSTPRRKCVVRLSRPVRAPGGSHLCRVTFSGLAAPREVHGEGPMQTVALAFTYIQIRLEALGRSGWTFYYGQRTREPFDFLQAWFPLRSKPRRRSNKSLERTREG
jgi:hypothetical protein